jgi:hypothetical protein
MTTFEKLLTQHIVLSELRDFYRAEYAREVGEIIKKHLDTFTNEPTKSTGKVEAMTKQIENELLKNEK